MGLQRFKVLVDELMEYAAKGQRTRFVLDFIEAFTPPPDCDTSVAQARAAWPGKVLSLNFPSSVHLRRADAIRDATRRIIEDAGNRRGFIMGITENVPWDAMQTSIPAILDVIEDCPLGE